MTDLFKAGEQRMSSKEIADITGKRHNNVLRDCDSLNSNYQSMNLLKIECIENQHPANGTKTREMMLTREQTFDLMTGYNAELRIKVNRRWAELESKQQSNLPTTFSEALRLAADQAEKLEKQAPKVEYHDTVLTSQSTYKTSQIAEELHISAIALNRLLKDKRVQRKVNGQWVLLSKHQGKGYTRSSTHTYSSLNAFGEKIVHTAQLTEWTEEGRRFIHNLFSK